MKPPASRPSRSPAARIVAEAADVALLIGRRPGVVMIERERGWMGGPGWAAAMLAPLAAQGWRLAYDAGALPGRAFAALDCGFARIISSGPAETAARLAAIASARGAELIHVTPAPPRANQEPQPTREDDPC